MAVAAIDADEAVASSDFVQIMGTPIKKLLVRVIDVRDVHILLHKGWWCDIIANHGI